MQIIYHLTKLEFGLWNCTLAQNHTYSKSETYGWISDFNWSYFDSGIIVDSKFELLSLTSCMFWQNLQFHTFLNMLEYSTFLSQERIASVKIIPSYSNIHFEPNYICTEEHIWGLVNHRCLYHRFKWDFLIYDIYRLQY